MPLFDKMKNHYAVFIVFITGLALRLYMTIIDPFLHPWDERFHALVAKNMMTFPLKPMLTVFPVAQYDPNVWCCNHIWLHKQPLFMWQMALSMKLFGVSEFAMRLPSAVMGALMILLVYRIGLLLTENKFTALLASLLMCLSYYQLELISGKIGMDHNDVAFGFYVLASIWAYSEYLKKPIGSWAVMIGFFVGAAILNKWLTGLLVFAPWFIKLVYDFVKHRNTKQIVHYFSAILVSIFVALPWQLYILHEFPEQARYEFAYNTKHIWEVVEGHWGDKWFYFDRFPIYFGTVTQYLLFLAFPIYFIKGCSNRSLFLSLTGMFVFVFLFFTFVVASKLTTYFFVVAPIGFILIGISLQEIIIFLFKKNKVLSFILVSFCAYKILNPNEILISRKNDTNRATVIYNTNIYKKTKSLIPENCKIVMNVNEFEHPDVMFYNKGITAYHWYIAEDDLKKLEKNKEPIAAFENHANYILPNYILNYKYLFIIKRQLR